MSTRSLGSLAGGGIERGARRIFVAVLLAFELTGFSASAEDSKRAKATQEKAIRGAMA